MITDNERREVARKLREPKESLLAYPADELIRLRHETGCARGQDFYEHLADLIDRPTCTIVCECDAYSSWGERIEGMRLYELSCGHQAVGFEKTRYCPECGMEVVKHDQPRTTERIQPAARML